MNKDGKVSWHEWQAIMFHEGGQVLMNYFILGLLKKK
jgi:hypothetical protein